MRAAKLIRANDRTDSRALMPHHRRKIRPFIADAGADVGKPFYMDHEEARGAAQYSRKFLAEKMIKIIGEYYGA